MATMTLILRMTKVTMMAGVVELDKTGRLSSQPGAWPLYTPSLFKNGSVCLCHHQLWHHQHYHHQHCHRHLGLSTLRTFLVHLRYSLYFETSPLSSPSAQPSSSPSSSTSWFSTFLVRQLSSWLSSSSYHHFFAMKMLSCIQNVMSTSSLFLSPIKKFPT